MSIKNSIYVGLIILFLAIGVRVYGQTINKAFAAGPGDPDGINLHLLVEESIDNGATWHNFTGTDLPGAEVLDITPGTTILFRLKVWNDGLAVARNVQILGEIDNTGHITGANVTNNQLGARPFNGFDLENGGTGTVAAVDIGSNQNVGFEGLQGTITFGDNFPNGQTIITGGAIIRDYALVGMRNNNGLIKRAFANGVNNFSIVRVSVNVSTGGSIGTPKITPSPSPSESVSATISSLPSTGGSILEDWLSLNE